MPDFLGHIDKDLREGGLSVNAVDIIDVMDGYQGAGHKANKKEELGKCLLLWVYIIEFRSLKAKLTFKKRMNNRRRC